MLKMYLTAVVFIVAMSCFALLSMATAQTVTLAYAGGWRAFGGLTNDNAPTCGVDVAHASTGRHFLIQWYSPNRHLTVRLIKQSWDIPGRLDIPVSLQIDSASPWYANALGQGREVGFVIARGSLEDFVQAFRQGLGMVVRFHDGNEPPWRFSLIGTNSIMNAFVECLRIVVPTQPHAGGSTQPFGRQGQVPAAPRAPSPPPASGPASAGKDQGRPL